MDLKNIIENIDLNNKVELIDQLIKIKKGRGRPPKIKEEKVIKTPRIKKTDDVEYFKKYYHSSSLSDKVICDICSLSVSMQKLKRHKLSKRCCSVQETKIVNSPSLSP